MDQVHDVCADTHLVSPTQTWDTAAVASRDAFDFYRDGICAAFMPLRPELDRRLRRHFQSKLSSYSAALGVLNIVSASAHQVNRGKAEIAASQEECCYLNFQLGSTCRIFQGGRDIQLSRGDVGLFDGAAAFTLEHAADKTLRVASIMIPKAVLRDVFQFEMQSAPAKLSTHPDYGHLLRSAAETLALSVGRVTQAEFSRLFEIVLSLTTLASSDNRHSALSRCRKDAQFLRINRVIRQSCRDSSFSIADCATRVGLSVGRVRNLFTENDDTFGRALLRERLRWAAEYLSDQNRAHQTVSEIAYGTGFLDNSHFGRAFRAEYGLPPGTWRRSRAAPTR